MYLGARVEEPRWRDFWITFSSIFGHFCRHNLIAFYQLLVHKNPKPDDWNDNDERTLLWTLSLCCLSSSSCSSSSPFSGSVACWLISNTRSRPTNLRMNRSLPHCHTANKHLCHFQISFFTRNRCRNDIRKITKYSRVATHCPLFKFSNFCDLRVSVLLILHTCITYTYEQLEQVMIWPIILIDSMKEKLPSKNSCRFRKLFRK